MALNAPVFADDYFNGTYDPTEGTVYRVDDTLSNLLDNQTNEYITFKKVNTWHDGTPMTDAKVDNVIYRKLNNEYFKRCYDAIVYAKWFGVIGDGVTDNTIKYDLIIKSIEEGCSIIFESGKTFKGSFNSSRSCSIDGGNSTFINPGISQRVFDFQGSLNKNFATLTVPHTYGNKTLAMSNITNLSKGDLIVLCDEAARPADGKNEINMELLKIKSVIDGVVEVEDMVRSEQKIGALKVFKIASLKNVTLSNMTIQSLPESNLEAVRFLCCEHVLVDNVNIVNNSRAAIVRQFCYDATSFNITMSYATNLAAGFGYGISSIGCRVAHDVNIKCHGLRNIYDLSTCYNVYIQDVKSYNSGGVVLAHNTYGGNIICEAIEAEGGRRAVSISPQGVEDFYNHIARDITIKDVRHVAGDNPEASLESVYIGCSYSNLIVENISLVITKEDYVPSNGHKIINMYGSPGSYSYINNIWADKCGIMLYIESTSPVTAVDSLSELNINNLYSKECNIVGYLRSPKNIGIGNVIVGTVNTYMFSIGTANMVQSFNFYGTLKYGGDSQILVKNAVAYSTVLLKGKKWNLNTLDNVPIPLSNESSIDYSQLEHRKILNLSVISGNKTLHSTTAFPNPSWVGQTFYIFLNDGGPKRGNFSDLIIPATNVNIHNQGKQLILVNGIMYKFLADVSGRWRIIEEPIALGGAFVERYGLSHSPSDGSLLTGYVNEGSITRLSIVPNAPGFPEGYGSVVTLNGATPSGTFSLFTPTSTNAIYVQRYKADGNGLGWFKLNEINSGLTANRPVHAPTIGRLVIGQSYFDTNLSKPIWWNGTTWVDAQGTVV